ncbi:MAG: metal ABC transporter permease, partial [Lachnospiraceae bacterium]|nr:metal ABC transporter permease [Lachnospiraceae bacterium]
MEIFDTLYIYFQYPIVVKALVAGVLIAFCSSLLGVSLVLKRYSFIGDGLSHVAFAALSIATLTSISNNMLIVLPITILAAVLMLRTGQNSRINGDAVVAMISVGCLAVGYMLMNIFSGSSNVSGDVCSTLFGSTSLLTLSTFDMWICIIMSMVVLIFFLLFYHKIFSVTFDENFAKATGIRSGAYNMLMAVITAVIIVLAMNLV